MLLTIAERVHDALVPFLAVGATTLLALLALLIGQRLFRAAAELRRQSLKARYRPVIDAALGAASPEALEAVKRIPGRHRRIAADLVLATLRVVRGTSNERARGLADHLDLSDRWREDLTSRGWWHRSEAASGEI